MRAVFIITARTPVITAHALVTIRGAGDNKDKSNKNNQLFHNYPLES